MALLTTEEYEVWLEDPITRKVKQQLEDRVLFMTQELGGGKTLDEDSADRTAILTAKSVGKIEGINEIFRIDVEVI